MSTSTKVGESRTKFKTPKYLKYRGDRARVHLNGKYIYLPGKHNSRESREAYQEIINQLVDEFREQENLSEPIKGDVLVVELMVAFLHHADEYYAASNEAATTTAGTVRRANVDELTLLKWKKVRQWMVDNGQTRSGVNKSMNRSLRMLKWGARNWYGLARTTR